MERGEERRKMKQKKRGQERRKMKREKSKGTRVRKREGRE